MPKEKRKDINFIEFKYFKMRNDDKTIQAEYNFIQPNNNINIL